MKNYASLIRPVTDALPKVGSLNAMLGFDGTVDVICKPVESREGNGSQFTPYRKIRDFGQRIVEADGKSAIVEIVNELEKIGGNGPVMANALSQSGLDIDYIGPLGQPDMHPAYAEFGRRIKTHSVSDPAITHALEFSNGKVMLSAVSNYEEITAETLESVIGETTMIGLIRQSQLCCLLNWTCLPGFNSILNWYLDTLLPAVGRNSERIFFFDLADPSMRSKEDLSLVLERISHFQAFGNVTLGMNLNEAQQVCRALHIPEPDGEQDSLCSALAEIRKQLNLHTTMAHPTHFAACATVEGSWAIEGPHTDTPRITTGAGDHLNAGFCLGQLLGFSPEDTLRLGVLYSGYYVRMAEPPALRHILEFIPEVE